MEISSVEEDMSGEEFEEYASALSELVINSKPIINSLTILAGEIAGQDESRAASIAELIREHIRRSPVKSKLCGFYLLDSVVKNLRGPFVRCFSTGLSDLFLPAYAKVDESQKKSMLRLFNTWKTVFPSSALDDIEPNLAPRVAPQAGRVAPPVTAPQSQWQVPPIQQQQWAPPAQQWTGYAGAPPQQPYAAYGQAPGGGVPPPPPALSGAAGGQMLANMLQSGSGGDLSALIASMEAKQVPQPAMAAPGGAPAAAQPGELPALTADFDPKKDLSALNKRRESVIRALYFELPFQCSQTGRRFGKRTELDAHMDWLHARRKRRRDGKVSRKWFVDINAWLRGLKTMAEDTINFFGGDDKDSAAEAHAETEVDENVSVPVDESQPACALSGEEFETFWNEEAQEWHYRGTMILDRAVGGAKKGSIVLARAVPKKRTAAKGAKTKTAAAVKTEDSVRRSGRGIKTKAEDAVETSPTKRTRTRK